jgi:hypothetical protein
MENLARKGVKKIMTMFVAYNLDLTTINASALVVVPIIIALVQAIKLTGFIDQKYSPLISLGIGIIISFLANHDTGDMSLTILSGVMYGLMASGLYSGVKTTMQAQVQSKRKGKNNSGNDNSGNDGNNFI